MQTDLQNRKIDIFDTKYIDATGICINDMSTANYHVIEIVHSGWELYIIESISAGILQISCQSKRQGWRLNTRPQSDAMLA